MFFILIYFLYASAQDLLQGEAFDPLNYSPPQVTVGDFRVIQYFQNLTFYYQISQDDLSRYLHFEIHLSDTYPDQSKSQMAFAQCLNEPCYMEQADGKNYLLSNSSDYNALWLQKYYAHLILHGTDYKLDDRIYFTLLIPKLASYSYLLDVNSYEFKPCPQDCMLNFQGECVQGKCKCESGFIDEDCSVDAAQLKEEGILNITVNYGYREYAYYQPLEDLKEDIEIGFKLIDTRNSQVVYVFVEIEDQGDLSLPTKEFNKQSFRLSEGVKQNYKTFKVKKELLKFDRFYKRMQRLIIGLQGSKAERSALEVRMVQEVRDDEPDINLILIYFLVGVAVILLATWIILTIIRIRYQRQNQVYDQQQARNRRRNRKKQTEALKLETIEKYMPKQMYSEIPEQKKQIEDSCAVCLVDFEASDSCRVTICFHVFHSDCLEQWLQKQQNCPICRSEHNEKTLASGVVEVLSGQDRNTVQEEGQVQQIDN